MARYVRANAKASAEDRKNGTRPSSWVHIIRSFLCNMATMPQPF